MRNYFSLLKRRNFLSVCIFSSVFYALNQVVNIFLKIYFREYLGFTYSISGLIISLSFGAPVLIDLFSKNVSKVGETLVIVFSTLFMVFNFCVLKITAYPWLVGLAYFFITGGKHLIVIGIYSFIDRIIPPNKMAGTISLFKMIARTGCLYGAPLAGYFIVLYGLSNLPILLVGFSVFSLSLLVGLDFPEKKRKFDRLYFRLFHHKEY